MSAASFISEAIVAEAARLDELPNDMRAVELVKLSATLPVMASISDRLDKGADVEPAEIDALAKGRGGKMVSDFVAYLGQLGRRTASGIRATPDKLPKTATAVGTVVAGAAALSACGPSGCDVKPKREMTEAETRDIIRRMRRDLIATHGRKAVREMDRMGRAQIRAEDAAQVKDGLLTQAQFDAKWPAASVADRKRKAEAAGFGIADDQTMGAARAKAARDGRSGRDGDGDGKKNEGKGEGATA